MLIYCQKDPHLTNFTKASFTENLFEITTYKMLAHFFKPQCGKRRLRSELLWNIYESRWSMAILKDASPHLNLM